MPTNYPANVDSYTTKIDNVSDVMAADVNNVQDAMVAVQTRVGTTASPNFVQMTGNQTVAGNKTFSGATTLSGGVSGTTAFTGTMNTAHIDSTSASGVRNQRAATQDAVRILGRAAGTGSFVNTITTAALTASRTVTLPDGNVTLTAGTSVATTRSITGGLGITGGGTLAADRTLSLDSTTGGIGTYGFLYSNNTTTYAPGATIAGSALVWVGIQNNQDGFYDPSASAPAGTWRVMGATSGTISWRVASLWMRIS